MELIIKGSFAIETADGFKIHPRVIELLKEIDISKSLNAAVKTIGMSYSHAWNLIYKTNCNLEDPIIITKRGGNGGGIAELTDHGKLLLYYHNKLEDDLKKFMGNHKINLI